MIKITNLTKKFGHLVAVDHLNLEVNKGEIFAFIGPNGAGKTTTIKMITGILSPTTGSVKIGNFDIAKDPVKAKKIIGYIPDDPYVYPELTGREFLHLIGHLFAVSQIEKKIEKLLPVYGLENIIDGSFKDYSRGNKQKVTILAALLHNPEVLVIDEPILGLDPLSAQITINLFKEFSKNGGTIFVSTHTLPVAQNICHRLGIIDKGKLIFEGNLGKLQKVVGKKQENLENLYLKLTSKTPT